MMWMYNINLHRMLNSLLKMICNLVLACTLLVNFVLSVGTGGLVILFFSMFEKEFVLFTVYFIYHALMALSLYVLWLVGLKKKHLLYACLLAIAMTYVHIQYVEIFDIFILDAD